jgi:hypothetical protein
LANNGSPVLLEMSVTLSANGRITKTQVDNDGNGLFERTEIKTVNADGSLTDVPITATPPQPMPRLLERIPIP